YYFMDFKNWDGKEFGDVVSNSATPDININNDKNKNSPKMKNLILALAAQLSLTGFTLSEDAVELTAEQEKTIKDAMSSLIAAKAAAEAEAARLKEAATKPPPELTSLKDFQ